MLTITTTETPAEPWWVLEGRLTRPWVTELQEQWPQTHRTCQGRTCVVDRHDVTGMDQGGEQIFLAMLRAGAHCLARGIYTYAHEMSRVYDIPRDVRACSCSFTSADRSTWMHPVSPSLATVQAEIWRGGCHAPRQGAP